jgi:hypothetical protein
MNVTIEVEDEARAAEIGYALIGRGHAILDDPGEDNTETGEWLCETGSKIAREFE